MIPRLMFLTAWAGLLAGAAPSPPAPADVTVEVKANGHERVEKPAEVSLNFTPLLQAAGKTGPLDPNSIRVEEVNAQGGLVDASVPFQFDKDPAYDAATNARGMLVFILKGTTAAGAVRLYRVSFDRTGGGYAPPAVTPQVTLTDNVQDEGQASYKVATQNVTYYYHKAGAGFSSMVDAGGNDWLNYHPAGGSAGHYRGIPNAVHPEGYFHAGNTGCASSLSGQGPIKVTISSQSNDGKWACRWEIYPRHARLTILKHDHPYWFLYEGTPGGSLDTAADFCVRSNGTKTSLATSWTGDIASPEWLYFGDGALNRVLFLAHHEDDGQVDSYWPMENNMTVFGFGRDGLNKYLNSVPQRFTIGFADDKTFMGASRLINSAYRDLVVNLPEEASGADPGDGGDDGGGGCGATGAEWALLLGLHVILRRTA